MPEDQESPQAKGSEISGKSSVAEVRELPGRRQLDAELVSRVRDLKDPEALKELASHYAPRLKSFLMQRGEQSQTAEDVVQDIFVKVWQYAHKFDGSKASFSTWIYRITRNHWIDHMRKQDRLVPTDPGNMVALSDDVVESAYVTYSDSETSAAVRKEFARLPVEQKRIMHLAFFEGLSHSQIAERTGLALGTVKSRIRLSLKKMQPGLKEYRDFE